MSQTAKPVTIIGSKELVDFPDLGLFKVHAKIDTGADSSAIWASEMSVAADGGLTYVLFGPRSRFYTGKKITTHDYRSTTVKNSFGVAEYRYKVRVLAQIEGRKIRAWFTLSNRADMRYPVLLGRRLLHGKFLVDVSQNLHDANAHTGTLEVALFGVKMAETRAFFEQVAKLSSVGARFVPINFADLTFSIAAKGCSIANAGDHNRDVATYSQAYFKERVRYPEIAAAVAEYLQFHNIFFVDREVASHVSTGKLSEYMRLACHGLPVPPSLCTSTPVMQGAYADIVERFGSPFVLKEAASNRGKNNYLVTNEADFADILQTAKPQYLFIAQKYIESDGFYRVYVLGKEVELVIWRQAHPHKQARKTHLNKPFGGANASLVEIDKLPANAHSLAIRAAACMDRQIAGVDILQDKNTGKWYILEVNYAPQLRSGAFTAEKAAIMARYFDKELQGNL